MRNEYVEIEFTGRPGKLPAVRLPLSKSIALRVMILDALSRAAGAGECRIQELPESEDIEGLQRALRIYLAQLCHQPVTGSVRIGEGGAPLRFFTALAASTPGIDITVKGALSLSRRPLKTLIDALRSAGGNIKSLRRPGRLPLRIKGKEITESSLTISPDISSQYISALMMAAPLWRDGLRINYAEGRHVSAPYIGMTAGLMRIFGLTVERFPNGISIPRKTIRPPSEICIEPDWSAASYFYEIALLLPGTVIGINSLVVPDKSLQGDSACANIFARAGVKTIPQEDGSVLLCREVEGYRGESEEIICLDMTDTPDLVPAIAVGFSLAGVRFRLSGISHLRHKESDRIETISRGMSQLGYILHTSDDVMTWEGARCQPSDSPIIDTCRDHRIAMAFAPAAICCQHLRIADPQVVKKSFPRYWEVLNNLGFNLDYR